MDGQANGESSSDREPKVYSKDLTHGEKTDIRDAKASLCVGGCAKPRDAGKVALKASTCEIASLMQPSAGKTCNPFAFSCHH